MHVGLSFAAARDLSKVNTLERVQVKWDPVYRPNARQSKQSGAGHHGDVVPFELNPL
jgi:hypothetical protein